MVEGWFPIYDTLEGMRGELLISVRLNYFGADTLGGDIRLFAVPRLSASVYPYQFMRGFVEELVVRPWRLGVVPRTRMGGV